MAPYNLVNIGSNNGLLTDTKPFPESMFTYHQWGLAAFIRWEIYRKWNISILDMSLAILISRLKPHLSGESYKKKMLIKYQYNSVHALHWRHTDHDGVSNHQPHCCLLNRLFRRRSKKTSKLRVTGLCVGNSPGPVNSPHKGPVTRKMFPFDDVIMWSSFTEGGSVNILFCDSHNAMGVL